MVLKRFTGMLNKLPGAERSGEPAPGDDSPETQATMGVRLFCESSSSNSGDEFIHLPTIVEAAVASPSAATAAAVQIRKFLSKDNYSRPQVQYNAIMLIRILADNPGPSFTKNVDAKFVETVKTLLRHGRDPSVQQILRETLDALHREKAYDTNMNELFKMWTRELGIMTQATSGFGPRTLIAPPWNPQSPPTQDAFGRRSHRHRSKEQGLPPPQELAARVEEARTSGKLLQQLIQSTPPTELPSNELVKEFAERCQAAQRSIQAYINCDNPAPDDDTMLTLIETNDQLASAVSKHHRAMLSARKQLGLSSANPSPPAETAAPAEGYMSGANTSATYMPPATTSTMGPSGSGDPALNLPDFSNFTVSDNQQQQEGTHHSSPLPQQPASSTPYIPASVAYQQPSQQYAPPPAPPPQLRERLNSHETSPDPMHRTRRRTTSSGQIQQLEHDISPVTPSSAAVAAHSHTEKNRRGNVTPSPDDPRAQDNPFNDPDETGYTPPRRQAPPPPPPRGDQAESYHPGNKPTQSYYARQEGAEWNTVMSGGTSGQQQGVSHGLGIDDSPNDVSPVEQRVTYRY